jgi:hypothetical protein
MQPAIEANVDDQEGPPSVAGIGRIRGFGGRVG